MSNEKPKLSKEQKEELYKIIEEGPEGFCGCWNSAMIQEVIQREFNMTYNVLTLSPTASDAGEKEVGMAKTGCHPSSSSIRSTISGQ